MDALAKDRSPTKAEKRLPAEGDAPSQRKPAGPAASDQVSANAAKPSWRDSLRQRPWLVAALAIAALIVIVAGVVWWLHARQYETTDDAFIDARTVSISSQVAGSIRELDVTDNQVVKAGAVLAQLDDAIYQARLGQARAQVAQAEANIANLDAQLDAQHSRIDQANKQVTEAQGALAFSQQENTRYQDLVKTGSGTEQRAQQASSDLTQKQAALAGAEANAITAEKQLAVLETQRSAADAQLEANRAAQQLAATNVAYATIRAPVDGRVTKLSANTGTYLQPGQSIMMFVPEEIWITANFKETQLDLMRPGQRVDISIDAFPERTFGGHIDSLQAGSGTAFSLLPAENATGNYIKVVQRIPVKIVFDRKPDVQLGPGMSVVPTVKVR
jgi:membrane fusion protein (multidrug efflux system)